MDSSINNVKSFNNERLVEFIVKIGHHEAAKIIQEQELDGQKILELTEMETLGWKLTDCQRNLLWICISQIKSNPLTYLDNGHHKHLRKVLHEGKNSSNSKKNRGPSVNRKKYNKFQNVPSDKNFTIYGKSNDHINNRQPQLLPVNKKKYYKFSHFNNQESLDVEKCISEGSQNTDESDSHKHISLRRKNHKHESRESFYYSCSSTEDLFDSSRTDYYTESEYIYCPCIEGTKDNTTVDRIKKYIKLNPGRKFSYDDIDEPLNNTNHVYLELCNLQESKNIPDKKITETHTYEEISSKENSQLPKEKSTKKSPLHFIINLCCFSCYVGCTTK